MTAILIFVINLIIFIVAMIGMLAAFFERRWKWFFPILFCVLLSAVGVFMELSQWFMPAPAREAPVFVRQPTSPL